MSEQMREDFSAWYLAEVTESYGKGCRAQAQKNLDWVREDGSFADPMLRLACLAWQASRESLPSLFTAVDMTTAAAQGFRDGVAKLKEAYRAGWDASGEGWNGEHPCDGHEHPDWAVARDKALEEIMQQVKP